LRILLYRRMLGEELKNIWKTLGAIHNQPVTMRTNAQIAAMRGESDKLHPSSIPIASANPPRIQFLDSCVQWP
jgi:hypothetical protein